jgi:hypothetical protein
MKLMTDSEVAVWCAQCGIEQRGRKLTFSNPYRSWIAIELPALTTERIALSGDLLLLGNSGETGESLIWITTWKIWSTWYDDLGEFVVTKLRAQGGEARPLIDQSGHLLTSGEGVLSTAMLLQTMLFNWDAFLVPSTGDHIIQNSHDELVWISCKSYDAHLLALEQLSRWKPKTREFITGL